MQKLHFSVRINAPKEKVWHAMLDDASYRKWTSAFMPGSYYDGEWAAGSKMRFLGPEQDGTVSGMLSEIVEVRPYDFVSIRHLGEILHGKESLWGGKMEGQEWLENYTFTEVDGGTEVRVDVDSIEEYSKMFQEMWPKALEQLKNLVEHENNS